MKAGHLALALLFSACARDLTVAGQDAEAHDRGTSDAGEHPMDAEASDRGATDALVIDAGFLDASGGGDALSMGDAGDPCLRDPFAVCDDPDEAARSNEDYSSAFHLRPENAGCPIGDTLVPLDITRSSRICPAESADWYEIGLVGCPNRTFIVEAIVDFTPSCADEDFSLATENYPGTLLADTCSDPKVQCVVGPGHRSISFVIEPMNFSYNMQFGLVSANHRIGFDYTLRVVVR
ncbi:MAG: hypothetical protein U1E65_10465 [Myxococcota bacterium]